MNKTVMDFAPDVFQPVALQIAGAVLLLLLLAAAIRILATMPRQADLQLLRLLAEQSLAGQRAESERTRAALAAAERALITRLTSGHLTHEQRLGDLTTSIARDQGDARALLEAKLREMADHTHQRLADIHRSVNEQLQQAVERQMQSSFEKVIDQFTAVQKAMADVAAVTAQIGDLKRVFSNVKSRGGWGETQLRALLDDLLPEGSVVCNARLRDGSAEVVEFAVRMPIRGDLRPLLAIDAKFPTSDYERLLDAADSADADAERAARRALEACLRLEARKIADKYIVPPATVEFAVMYLPSDALYAEAARIPGLIDELGQRHHVMVMGPSLLPALLRTVQLGYVTLALEQKAGHIAELLGATKREMLTMDATLEKLAKNAGAMTASIEDARRRTRAVTKKLKGMETLEPLHANRLLALEEEKGASI
jgi:DNA recombination protein RmuC